MRSGMLSPIQKAVKIVSYSEYCQLVLNPVAVEKGIKAVISVNFSAYGKRHFNNLRANFVREIPREEFFNTYRRLHSLRISGQPTLRTRQRCGMPRIRVCSPAGRWLGHGGRLLSSLDIRER